MIVKGKDVIGLKVVTIDTGTVIETVDDIAYDPTNHRIVALLVDGGGLFSSAKVIHMDDVRNIGEDAVIVADATVIRSVKELSDDVRSISDSNKHLVKTNVLTVDGKELGKITDLYFDSTNGFVDSMEVSQGGIKTMTEGKKSIKPVDIVTIGADATIVTTYTELVLEAQGEAGGLKGMVNDAKDKAAEIAADTKEAVQDATDKTIAATKQATEVVKDTSSELADKAQIKAAEIERDTRGTRREAARKADELADTMSDKVKDIRATAQDKAADAQRAINEVTEQAQEAIQHGKEELKNQTAHQGTARDHSGGKVVAETTRRYEDRDKTVVTKKTVVKK